MVIFRAILSSAMMRILTFLDGFIVNRQHCRILGSDSPRVIIDKQMHVQSVTA